MTDQRRLVLASASPARLGLLRQAGFAPEVIVSGVDEDALTAPTPGELALVLAEAKAGVVAALPEAAGALVIGCDSVLAFEGEIFGKPAGPVEAAGRWRRMRGRSGVLHTGHCVRRGDEEFVETASTIVHFASISDAEIDAYVATGEPLHVAGAFTIDGLGGAFVTGVEGDHHNVIGLSLPLLRDLVGDLGIAWPDLWSSPGR